MFFPHRRHSPQKRLDESDNIPVEAVPQELEHADIDISGGQRNNALLHEVCDDHHHVLREEVCGQHVNRLREQWHSGIGHYGQSVRGRFRALEWLVLRMAHLGDVVPHGISLCGQLPDKWWIRIGCG